MKWYHNNKIVSTITILLAAAALSISIIVMKALGVGE